MKLKGTDLMATTAIALGTGQLLVHALDVYKSKDLSSYSFPSVFIGVSASLLWTLYQFNKEGMNYSVVYSGFGLAVQLYILQKLINHKNNPTTDDRHEE
jgi:uncharacterized protein with PQ loop repeat